MIDHSVSCGRKFFRSWLIARSAFSSDLTHDLGEKGSLQDASAVLCSLGETSRREAAGKIDETMESYDRLVNASGLLSSGRSVPWTLWSDHTDRRISCAQQLTPGSVPVASRGSDFWWQLEDVDRMERLVRLRPMFSTDRSLVCGIDSFFGSTGTVQDLPDSIHRKPVCFNRIDRAFVWMWSVLCHPSNEKRIFVLPSFFDRKSVVGSRQSAK